MSQIEAEIRLEISNLLLQVPTFNAIAIDGKGRQWRLNSSLGELPLLSRFCTEGWPIVEISTEIDQYLQQCEHPGGQLHGTP